MMKLTASMLLAMSIMAQSTNLTKRPIVLAPTVNEYVETFPSTMFATPNSPLVTAKPIKNGTTVMIMVNELANTPIKFFTKTDGPITLTLGADQISSDTTVTIAYKSEQ